ncbi:MAG TPA: NADH-quinone oxidoreductase subunit J [Smithellaceae bacterium]|nr:NADH-quinone oxidoreductase subunit J [Smithellaceae bacterium]
MIEQAVFWILSIIMVVSALGVIMMKSAINSVICLLLTMLSLAGVYVLQGSYIVALFQIIVYVGAIVVLFLFVVMLLNIKNIRREVAVDYRNFIISSLAVLTVAGVVCILWYALRLSMPEAGGDIVPAAAGVKEMALELLNRHLLALELVSVLLLAGAVGALLIGRKE